jgi:hypothetical protein
LAKGVEGASEPNLWLLPEFLLGHTLGIEIRGREREVIHPIIGINCVSVKGWSVTTFMPSGLSIEFPGNVLIANRNTDKLYSANHNFLLHKMTGVSCAEPARAMSQSLRY